MAVSLAAALLSLSVAALVTTAAAGRHLWASTSGPVVMPALPARSEVYAADGSLLSVLHSGEDRQPVKLADVPPVLVHAVVDLEDHDFFDHWGVSPSAIARAGVANAREGTMTQGGSTITQQLVKNTLVDRTPTLSRKLKEAVLARRLENQMSKEQILERYLNTVYFGHGAYGVQAAAERYFGVAVGNLEPDKAALLAGLIASPGLYDPFARPQAAAARRAKVLAAMVDRGHLSAEEAARFGSAALPTKPVLRSAPGPNAPFLDEVVRSLLDDPRLGAQPSARYAALFGGGLRIETTLDPRLQQAGQAAVAAGVPPSPFTAALVAVDPSSGEVRALVSPGEGVQQGFNLATQGARQAGSAFKVVTLAAALEQGHSPQQPIDGSAPCVIPLPGGLPPWQVDNYEGSSGGVVTLQTATARSLNCAYARLVMTVGPERVADVARRLGVRRPLQPVPSITLGALEVSPLDMATVFATLAAQGVRHDPVFVRRVVDPSGGVLVDNRPNPARAIDAEVTRIETQVLTSVVTQGTGRAAALPGRPVAGKTGTASEWRDAWFGGFVPQLAAVVWMGAPQGQVPMVNVGGIRVTGGSYPARIWSSFMTSALAGQPVVGFAPPAAPPPAAHPPPARPRQRVARPPSRSAGSRSSARRPCAGRTCPGGSRRPSS